MYKQIFVVDNCCVLFEIGTEFRLLSFVTRSVILFSNTGLILTLRIQCNICFNYLGEVTTWENLEQIMLSIYQGLNQFK
jgi:hypothetical protein